MARLLHLLLLGGNSVSTYAVSVICLQSVQCSLCAALFDRALFISLVAFAPIAAFLVFSASALLLVVFVLNIQRSVLCVSFAGNTVVHDDSSSTTATPLLTPEYRFILSFLCERNCLSLCRCSGKLFLSLWLSFPPTSLTLTPYYTLAHAESLDSASILARERERERERERKSNVVASRQ